MFFVGVAGVEEGGRGVAVAGGLVVVDGEEGEEDVGGDEDTG